MIYSNNHYNPIAAMHQYGVGGSGALGVTGHTSPSQFVQRIEAIRHQRALAEIQKADAERSQRIWDSRVETGTAIEIDPNATVPERVLSFLEEHEHCDLAAAPEIGKLFLIVPDAETAALARLSL